MTPEVSFYAKIKQSKSELRSEQSWCACIPLIKLEKLFTRQSQCFNKVNLKF